MGQIAELFISIGSAFNPAGFQEGAKQTGLLEGVLARTVFTAGDLVGAVKSVGNTVYNMGSAIVKAGSESQQANLLLAESMRQAGTFTEGAYDKALKYADALQKTTAYGDEEIKGVQKMLSHYGIQGPMMDQLTKATLDLASAKGMDLASAGEVVSKSVGGETNALARYGITIEGAKGSTERMSMAVQNINNLFGGSAQAYADTYAGKVKMLANQWDEVVETLGNALLPYMNQFLNIVRDVALPVIESFTSKIKGSNTGFETMISIGKFVIETVVGIIGVVDILSSGVAGLALLVTGHFAGAGEAFKDMKVKFTEYGTRIAEISQKDVEIAKTTAQEKTALVAKENVEKLALVQARTQKEKEYAQALADFEYMTGAKTLQDKRNALAQVLAETEKGTKKEIEIRTQLYNIDKELRDRSFLGGWKNAIDELKKANINYGQVVMGVYGSITQAVAGSFNSMLTGAMNLGQGVAGIFEGIKQTIIQKCAEILAQEAVKSVFQLIAKAGISALGLAGTVAVGAVALASIASTSASNSAKNQTTTKSFADRMNEWYATKPSERGPMPTYAEGGISLIKQMAMVDPNEMHLPLDNPKTISTLSQALAEAQDSGTVNNQGTVRVDKVEIITQTVDLENAEALGQKIAEGIKKGLPGPIQFAKVVASAGNARAGEAF